uniref:Uncharacterized protein n=1 Tax=Glossina palpalis gambiensis TaxID=67801 RepID=A0A1B0AWZ5_9MUSC
MKTTIKADYRLFYNILKMMTEGIFAKIIPTIPIIMMVITKVNYENKATIIFSVSNVANQAGNCNNEHLKFTARNYDVMFEKQLGTVRRYMQSYRRAAGGIENHSKVLATSVYDLTMHYQQTNYVKFSRSRTLAVKEADTIFSENVAGAGYSKYF